MQKKKLNKFIILSVAFHVILISAVLLYFIRNPLTVGKSGTDGTVMVGVISNEGSSNSETSLSNKTDINKTSNEQSNPKIALEKKPVKESIKNQEKTRPETQKENIKPAQQKAESSKQIADTASTASEKNSSKSGKEIASVGHGGNTESNNPGNNGANNTLAYPDYNINPKPKYPRVARKRGYEGEVKLKVLVLSDGRVGDIQILTPSGHKVLDDEAIETVKGWIFVPGKQDGKEISSWVTVPITFQLKNS